MTECLFDQTFLQVQLLLRRLDVALLPAWLQELLSLVVERTLRLLEVPLWVIRGF